MKQKRCCVSLVFALVLLLLTSSPTSAQLTTLLNGGRFSARNGQWLSPVAGALLASDEKDHLARNSVWAWDLAVPFGTPIYPMAGGHVIYAGCNNAGGYGCWALIDHEDGFLSIYAHMIDEGGGQTWINTGDKVTQWTPLGRVGWTGKTTFGPHVHWEIQKKVGGRIRLDEYFDRNSVPYCRFCSAAGNASTPGGLNDVVMLQQPSFLTSLLARPEATIGLILLFLLVFTFARPELSIYAARGVGSFFLGTIRASRETVQIFRQSYIWFSANVLLSLVLPLALCSSLLAFQVWMVEQGISYQDFFTYVHYGFYPYFGGGYTSGLQYSAVWGSPCQSVGTLGQVCSVDDIVAQGVKWQSDVYAFTGKRPNFAVIPRLSQRFGVGQVRTLIYVAHQANGLVIVDTEADIAKAKEMIDQLVNVGLDGVAIDMEFMRNVTAQDIRDLAHYFADRRTAAGISGEGVLVVWNVFHNINQGGDLSVEGVKVVPIFTGYGASATKVAGLAATQRLFAVSPANSGLMAFDQRWPINFGCRGFGLSQGFDCQSWYALFSDPAARSAGWWVQQ